MRYIKISEARAGMILAKDVYDNCNRLLLTKQRQLTTEYIEKLRVRGYPGIYIADKLSEGIEIEETISIELRNRGVESLRNHDIDAGLDVAKDIVEQIMANSNVSLDMVDLRTFDDYTYRHSVNVAVLSTIIGMKMNFPRVKLEELCVAAVFHDLGKLMIDANILKKPGRLTKEEFTIIKGHPQLSVELLKERWEVTSASKVGILFHHENEDGTGYPNGLESSEIHPYAKIIHVADVYDALTSKRPYKDPYTPSEAIEYLMGGCGSLFSEPVVLAFLKSVPVYPKGSTIRLSDGRECIVFANNRNPLRPVVRVQSGELLDLSDISKYRNITVNPSDSVETDYSNEMAVLEEHKKLERKVILVADNTSDGLQKLRTLLEGNYQIVMAQSGTEIIEFLRKNEKPDLLLTEVLLPQMDGIEAVSKIRLEISTNLPVIFMTSLSDRATVEKCKALHMTDYIVKPYKPTYLLERIQIALEESDLCSI